MPEQPMFSRWDMLNPTNILAAVHLGIAFSVYHRPYLPEILPSYARFDEIMPWATWGWAALGIALLMLFTPRSSGWRVLAHISSAMFFGTLAAAFAGGVGITSGSTTYAILAGASCVLMARTAAHWASEMPWWRRLVDRPPRWLRRLARVGEFERDKNRPEVD